MTSRESQFLVHVDYSPRAALIAPRLREQLVSDLMEAAHEHFPVGFNLAVVGRDETIVRAWAGSSCVVGETIATTEDTLYDIASLTKVIVTTTLALWLVDQKRWKLSDKVASWLAGFPRRDITLHHLLTHTSGLIAHRPFFNLGRSPRAIRRALYDEAAIDDPPGAVLYSDLNFMLLGWAIEHCAATPLKRLFRDVVSIPLGMSETMFQPSARLRPVIAATELDGDQRLEPGLVWGDVHDGNAWALGGCAGHAGLFSSTRDMSRFVSALLDPRHHPVLSASAIGRMTREQAGQQPDVRALGWRLDPLEWGKWPEGTYWHTGFTGTSLLVSPQSGIGVVLLSNAIHPTRQLERQQAFRAQVHRSIARWHL